MITSIHVGADIYQTVEGSLRTQLHKFRGYDWWQAGIESGAAPREWEILRYGREHALAWWLDGMAVPEAVNMGVKAMYQFAYGDIRDTIRRRGPTAQSATSMTQVDGYLVGGVEDGTMFDLLDVIASAPLSDVQKRMVTMYLYGWTRTEAVVSCGVPVRTGHRRMADAFNVLKGEL